jgi:hypothetical protein
MWHRVMGLVVVVLAAVVASTAQEKTTLEFELEDQFRQVHRSSDFLGTVVLLIGSDKKGVEFNDDWGRAILMQLQDHPRRERISSLGYANLKGVPFFLKGTIRGKFPQEREAWVLMDWKGELFKAYSFVPGASNALVFGPDGSLAHHASGAEPPDGEVAELVGVIRKLLDDLP